jgi:Tfp pilus assembly PilM family ATPase
MNIASAQLILLKQGKVISVYPIVVEGEDVFLQQIKRGMQIFSVNVEKILLTGYLPYPEKLQIWLGSQLAIHVDKLDSFRQVVFHSRLNPEKINARVSELLVAFGLGLRGFTG